jgi:5-deoxy-glucuronate isomerase
MRYTAANLVIHPKHVEQAGLIVEVTPDIAGWEYIHFQSYRLAAGQSASFEQGAYEIALVVFSGTLSVTSNHGEWKNIGKRSTVFSGLPEALYLSRNSNLTIKAETACEFSLAWVPAWRDHPPRLITQQEITVELRGGDNVTRQINGIIRPGFDCDRLIVVEVLTPSGNWSSYPPHKHDVHRVDENGNLLEADLEEVYYYKIDKPEGYAFQRVYTGKNSPLQQAGEPIDEVLMLRNDDLVLIPEGFHPVTSAPGYTTYYLNVLAGSAHALNAVDDPLYAWVKETYRSKDSRVPLYPVRTEQII